MKRIFIRTYDVKLTYFSVDGANLAELRCRNCRGLIDVHQPNPAQPEKILGTCPHCGLWYFLEASGDGQLFIALQIPERVELLTRPLKN